MLRTRRKAARPRATGGARAVKVFQIERRLRKSGVQNGIACIYSPHTTCCIRLNEFERGFLEDFATLLKRLVPHDSYYAHDDWDRRTENICPEDMEAANGHSHCM